MEWISCKTIAFTDAGQSSKAERHNATSLLSICPTLEAGKPPSKRPLHSAVYFDL